MKILFISTTDIEGGAAIAAYRLYKSLRDSGFDIKMLVGKKSSDDNNVFEVYNNPLKKVIAKSVHCAEKLKLSARIKSTKDIFFFSDGEFGSDISTHPLVREADVIHYHWVNHTFLSLKNLKQLTATGKPIVSHLHDMWAFTGGCHYAGVCANFQSGCGSCKMLARPSQHDISSAISLKKKDIYNAENIQFVTSSDYLKNIALTSSLLKDKDVAYIPVPIDTKKYSRKNYIQARKKLGLNLEKNILLFGVQNIAHKRKGFQYFVDAVNHLAETNKEFRDNVEVAVFGKCKEDIQHKIKVKVNYLGVLNLGQLNDAYSAADAYVLPSLEDNLPNTVLESLACETPVVAFKTGGIPEMIEHKTNGYLSDYQSVESLAEGIMWTIGYRPKAKLNKKLYGMQSVAAAYDTYYKRILAKTRPVPQPVNQVEFSPVNPVTQAVNALWAFRII